MIARSARLKPAPDALSSVVIRTSEDAGALVIEVQEVHPAEDAVRARFLERIAYFELELQAPLREELERLLGLALIVHPAPFTDVTRDELLDWLHHRAWSVYRGGNNVAELPDDCVQAARDENEALIARTQRTEMRSHDELRDAALLHVARSVSDMRHKTPEWEAVLLAERIDRSVRMVEAGVQQLFGRRIGELRAELAARNA